MSSADSLANVALRPWPAAAKEAPSRDELLSQIEQLTQERGHLRGITAKALQDEIDAGKSVPEDVVEGVEQEQKQGLPSREDKLKEIQSLHGEVWKRLEWAAFAGSNALNLIALILSRDPSKNLDNAYSVGFKTFNVPSGSMGLDKGEPPDRSNNAEERKRLADNTKRRELVMKGSRMEALDWATDSLLKAATNLETEIRKETKYWDEVLSISEKGWSLQRTRRDARHAPFAVRYGLPEANTHFKGRGLAPLRMDKNGGIILDPNLQLKPKTMRVRIADNDEITGTSQLAIQGDLSELAIEQSIQLARDSLFEEELFHEMSIETRQLLAYGVELRNSVIHIASPGLSGRSSHRKILIDCVSRENNFAPIQGQSQDWLAQHVADALRLLLAHEHRMRLYRRSQVPPPLTQHKRQQPNPPVLRTLLGVFSHLNAVDSLHAYVNAVAQTLRSAGLKTTTEASRETSWVKMTSIVKGSRDGNSSATDQILANFTRPFEGTVTISLPSSSATQLENITIDTRTYVGQPTFGAEHKLTLPPSLVNVLNLEHDQQRQFKFSSTQAVKSYLDWILSLDISHTLLFKEYTGRSLIKAQEPRVAIHSKGSKKGFIKEDDVSIDLENAALKVTAMSNTHLATGATTESYTWKEGALDQPDLKEKLKSWIG